MMISAIFNFFKGLKIYTLFMGHQAGVTPHLLPFQRSGKKSFWHSSLGARIQPVSYKIRLVFYTSISSKMNGIFASFCLEKFL